MTSTRQLRAMITCLALAVGGLAGGAMPVRAADEKAPTVLSSGVVHLRKPRGRVYIWMPGFARWRMVETNQQVPVGSLLQLSTGASVQVRFPMPGLKEKLGFHDVEFSLTQPMVVRLDEALVRGIKVNKYYFNESQKRFFLSKGKMSASAKLYYTMMEAWERDAIFSYFDTNDRQLMKSVSEQHSFKDSAFSSSVKIGKIDLLYPYDGSIIPSVEMPTRINIYWRPLGKDDKYVVYIWERGKEKKDAYFMTRDHSVTFEAQNEGEFNVQITARDDAYQSPIHTVKIFSIDYLSDLEMVEDNSKEEKTQEPPLKLTSPGDHTWLYSANGERIVKFCWSTRKRPLNTEYTLTLLDKQLNKRYRGQSQRDCFATRLRPGAYEWQVKATSFLTVVKNAEATEVVAYSPKRDLVLQQGAFSEDYLLKTLESGFKQGRAAILLD